MPVIQGLCRMELSTAQETPGREPLYQRPFTLVGPADEREHILLCHPAQCLERGSHLLLREAHQQPIVLHADLIDGLTSALL